MIHEQRVKLMSRLAMYEKKEGKKNVQFGTYFRSDYLSLRILGSVLSGSAVYLLGLVLYVLYDSEEFVNMIYRSDVAQLAEKALLYYVIFVSAYALITYVVFAFKYRKARNRLKVYFNNLRRLQILYQRERKEKRQ